MRDDSQQGLDFLWHLPPIPEDAEAFAVPLLEKDNYGHFQESLEAFEPVKIYMPREGARRVMDAICALRLEAQKRPAFSPCEMKFQPEMFRIALPFPAMQHGALAIRSNGLCFLTIGEISGRWKKTFWLSMPDVHRIAGPVPSSLTPSYSGIGNLEASIYSFNKSLNRSQSSTYVNENMISMPILSRDKLKLLGRRVIPWHGVEPVSDGRLGVAGYLISEDSGSTLYGALDIFVRVSESYLARRFEEGIIFFFRLADKEPDGCFLDAISDSLEASPKDTGHYIWRAMADLRITYGSVDPSLRSFHNSPALSRDEGEALLSQYGMRLTERSGLLDILWHGRSMLELDEGLASDAGDRKRKFVARFVDNAIHNLRDRPFLYRRNVIMNMPLDALKPWLTDLAEARGFQSQSHSRFNKEKNDVTS